MAIATLATLEQDLSRRLGGYAAGRTGTDSDLTQLIDTGGTGAFLPLDSHNRFKNGWLLITSGSNNDQIRTIGTYLAGTGVTTQGDLSFSIHTGATYEIHTVLPPTAQGQYQRGLRDCIADAARNIRLLEMVPVTPYDDGDMSYSGTNILTASSGAATVTKIQATFNPASTNQRDTIWSGRRAVRSNCATNDSVATPTLDAQLDSTYVFEFVARISQSGEEPYVHVRGADAGNDVFADTRVTLYDERWRHYRIEVATGSTAAVQNSSEQLIFETGAGQLDIDHIQLVRNGQTIHPLPAFVTSRSQVKAVYRISGGSANVGGADANTNVGQPADKVSFSEIRHWDVKPGISGGRSLRLEVGRRVGGPEDDEGINLWIKILRPVMDYIPARGDVIPADSDLILDGAEAYAYQTLKDISNTDDVKKYNTMQRKAMLRYNQRIVAQRQKLPQMAQLGGWTDLGSW
jgi:hypothetical protein